MNLKLNQRKLFKLNFKKVFLSELKENLESLISVSDTFEISRVSLLKKLDTITDIDELKSEVKMLFEMRAEVSKKHNEFSQMIVNKKDILSEKEKSELFESLACGYKHLRSVLASKE